MSSKFYKGLKKSKSDGTIAVYLSSPTAPSFLRTIYTRQINYFVDDTVSTDYSKLALSARVLVESSSDCALVGTVIKKEAMNLQSSSKSRYRLTVRLDSDGNDVEVENQKVLLLPFQLERQGKKVIFSLSDTPAVSNLKIIIIIITTVLYVIRLNAFTNLVGLQKRLKDRIL